MDTPSQPWGLHWRSSPTFIIATVAVGLFTDLFLYGLVVPVLPFMLRDRLLIPEPQIQSYVSGLLAAYAASSVLFSLPVGWIADQMSSRRTPFLVGLALLLISSTMFAFGQNIAILVVARILQGMSAAVVWTAGLAMVLDTVGPGNLGRVIGSIMSVITIGELIAPVAGGILYDTGGNIAVFGIAVGILLVDFLMRLLIIESKVAAKYDKSNGSCHDSEFPGSRHTHSPLEADETQASERDALLQNHDNHTVNDESDESYKIHGTPGIIIQKIPILYCFRNPRLTMGLLLSFFQSTLIATFDATMPIEAEHLFGFDSLQAGLLFIPANLPYLALALVAGWAVDKYGTKITAVAGFAYLVPCLFLLRLPAEGFLSGEDNLILYCIILALNGVGFAIVGAPGFVEASDIIQKYDDANPGFFGVNGPYAQLYGFSSVFFFTGLTVGPILSGMLRDRIGYGDMNAILAAVSAVASVMSFFIVGGKPRIFSSR